MEVIGDPAQLQALSQLGAVAFFIALTVLWLRRVIITHGEKKEAIDALLARISDKDAENEYLHGLVKQLTSKLTRFQRVLERVTDVQVPLADDEDDA